MNTKLCIIITCLLLLISFMSACGNDSNVISVITPTPTTSATPTGMPSMVPITGGTFNMGSTVSTSEQPVHKVTVSSFRMFTYEVTNSEYVLFLNAQGNQTEGGVSWINIVEDYYQGIRGGPEAGTFSVRSGYESRPVVYVSWYGAVAYCNWLSEQHGLTPCYGPINNRGDDPSVWRTLNGYRLPAEAEWEYACRGGNTADYYWGEFSPSPASIAKYSWYWDNAEEGYENEVNPNDHGAGKRNGHNAGQKLPNAFGLYDMSGNVWEWCSDWNSTTYYGVSPDTNPSGPGSGTLRVLRGGSWHSTSEFCRSACRNCLAPNYYLNCLGFRPVRNY
ncbi:MAG: formylglycine-generating enzyme family protein [Candidatus Eremiobacterota bacterium]